MYLILIPHKRMRRSHIKYEYYYTGGGMNEECWLPCTLVCAPLARLAITKMYRQPDQLHEHCRRYCANNVILG
mgnify:CR=1 FL=1